MSIGINLGEFTEWTFGISRREMEDESGIELSMITIGLVLIEINIIF